jgi:UPF0271 protein
MRTVDLNCDLGEEAGQDAALMPLVSSANIACGAHAGNAATMAATVALARRHGTAIGAHPGFADRENFGRVERPVGPAEAARLVNEQIAALARFAGADLRHVKLHGALYNQVARDPALAAAVADGLAAEWPGLVVLALAGSEFVRAARRRGLTVAEEVFADRTYRADGSLTPRSRTDALIHDEETAVAQVRRMVREGRVRSVDGGDATVRADTVCVHGDGARAAAFAARLRVALAECGVTVKACGA